MGWIPLPVQDSSDGTPAKNSFADMQRVAIFAVVIIGIAFLVTVAYGLSVAPSHLPGLVLWTAALLVCGGAIGFLFGIPRVLQAPREARTQAAGPDDTLSAPAVMRDGQETAEKRLAYEQRVNTNLEEISDWLTKIIVGLGLIELRLLPERLSRLAAYVATTLGTRPDEQSSACMAIILFFSVAGFLFGYLTTRLYLQGALARAERDLGEETGRIEQKVAQTRELTARKRAAGEMVPPSPAARHIDDDWLELWNQDPHRGRFGGSSVANGRELSATIVPALGPSRAACYADLEVRSTSPDKPLTGSVKFYLHPTFDEPEIEVPVNNGVAALRILSFGAFTVGAEADGGQTRLELDLYRVPGGSTSFYED